MKMNYCKYLILGLSAAIFACCTPAEEKSDPTPPVVPEKVEVVISAEAGALSTRGTLSEDGVFTWSMSDAIGVPVEYSEDGETKLSVYRFTATEVSGRTASFKGYIPGGGKLTGTAVYPYSAELGKVEIEGGSSASSLRPLMAAPVKEDGLKFKALTSVLSLSWSNVPAGAAVLNVSSSDALCGTFTLSGDGLSIEPSADAEKTMSVALSSVGTALSAMIQVPAGAKDISFSFSDASGAPIPESESSVPEGFLPVAGTLHILPTFSLTAVPLGYTVTISHTDAIETAPSLARAGGYWWCVFRKGESASGPGGELQLMRSADGASWEAVRTFSIQEESGAANAEYVEFNGSSQYMRIPHHEDFDFGSSDSFSISGWVWTDNTTYTQIVSTRNGGSGYDFAQQDNYLITDFGTPYLRAQTRDKVLTSGEWHHVGYSYDGSSGTFNLYVDGEAQPLNTTANFYPQTAFTTQENTYGNHIFVFAKASNKGTAPSGGFTKGRLKTLRFWNKALSGAEMAADMNASVSASTSGLVAAYDFAGVSSSTVEDITGKHPGTLVGVVSSWDLRDPKLIQAQDGTLMLLTEAVRYDGTTLAGRYAYVSRLQADGTFPDLERSTVYGSSGAQDGSAHWIWNGAFKGNTFYGVDYIWKHTLVSSDDYGSSFRYVSEIDRTEIGGSPSETALCFSASGKLYAFVRENAGAWLCTSDAPYSSWTYKSLGYRLENQSVVLKDADSFLVASRKFDAGTTVAVYELDLEGNILKTYDLTSSGDCGSPSLVLQDDEAWVAWYSSHEGGTGIYLTRLKIQ